MHQGDDTIELDRPLFDSEYHCLSLLLHGTVVTAKGSGGGCY